LGWLQADQQLPSTGMAIIYLIAGIIDLKLAI